MQQINLLTPALIPAKPLFPAVVMLWLLAAILGVGAPSALWFWLEKEAARIEHDRVLAEFDALNARLESQALQASLASGQDEPAGRSAAHIQRQLYARLEEIARPARMSARLQELAEASLAGVWLREIELAPAAFRLKGHALAADLMPAYLRRLAQQPGFTGASVAQLKIEADPADGYIAFALDSAVAEP